MMSPTDYEQALAGLYLERTALRQLRKKRDSKISPVKVCTLQGKPGAIPLR